jgi:aminopeptidase YwaD
MRRKFLELGVICLVALTALGQQPAGAQGNATTTVNRVRAHINYLASDKLEGRRTGTAGAEMAASYIANQFAGIGLAPGLAFKAERYKTKNASEVFYLQPFPFVAGVELGQSNGMLFAPGVNDASAQGKSAASMDLRLGEDWMPQGFSPSAQVLNTPATFVGYGITSSELKYDDYAGADVTGRIAIAFAGTPDGDNPHGEFARYADVRWKTIAARDHGAKALVVIAREENFKDDRLSRLSYDNSSGDAGLPVVAISRQAAAQVLGIAGPEKLNGMEDAVRKLSSLRLASLKKNPTPNNEPPFDVKLKYEQPRGALTIKTDIRRREHPAKNVIGVLEGSDPKLKGEAIIIGAHYDHLGLGGEGSLAPREGEVHHGADDNASGVAGVIELARAFSKAREKPGRTLIFIAFSGEEEGLLGSNFYVNHPVWPLAQTVAMINMDMIGRMKEKSLIVGGIGTAREWRAQVENGNLARLNLTSLDKNETPTHPGIIIDPAPVKNVDAYNGRPIPPPEKMFKLTLNEDGYGPSDHSSFYAKRVPVLFFWTGTHEDYHKPSDTADKINYEDEVNILLLVHYIVDSIGREEQRPSYTVAKSESAGRSMGFRVYLGTIPNYAETGDGLKLDGVRDDSPAAAAGLKAGDVIVKLAGRDIHNVYDYTYALGEMKAGQEYEVEAVRGTEHLKLKLIPAARK